MISYHQRKNIYFTNVVLADSVHDHDPHAEYAFAKCEFIQYLPPIDDESVQPPPMKPIGPLFVSGIQQGAPVAGAPVDEATPAGFIPAHFISMRMRQRVRYTSIDE